MKVKITGSLVHPTYKAATTAIAGIFAPVAEKVTILAAAKAVEVIPDSMEAAVPSRPVINYVETIGKETAFDLALDDPKAAGAVIAALKVEAQNAGVVVVGTSHLCRHDEDPSKWTPCVASPLGGK